MRHHLARHLNPKPLLAEDWAAAIAARLLHRARRFGTLPEAKMRWYLVQDYMFVDGFVRLLDLAIVNNAAPTLDRRRCPRRSFWVWSPSGGNQFQPNCKCAPSRRSSTSDALERQSPPAPATRQYFRI